MMVLPVCAECRYEMEKRKSGLYLETGDHALHKGDFYRCPSCGIEIYLMNEGKRIKVRDMSKAQYVTYKLNRIADARGRLTNPNHQAKCLREEYDQMQSNLEKETEEI